MSEQIVSSFVLKAKEEKLARAEKVRQAERKINADEKLVNPAESAELQRTGAVVVAVFEVNGIKKHKIKLPKLSKKNETTAS